MQQQFDYPLEISPVGIVDIYKMYEGKNQLQIDPFMGISIRRPESGINEEKVDHTGYKLFH